MHELTDRDFIGSVSAGALGQDLAPAIGVS
jgi:hypothetical protein